MTSGELILWNAIAICEMSKTSWQKGKLPTKDDLENHSNGQLFPLEQWLNIIRFQREIYQGFTNLARTCCEGFGKEIFWLQTWKIWKSSTHQTFILEESTRRRSWSDKKSRWIHIPSSRWYSKSVRKRPRIPRTHSQARTNRKEWRSQWWIWKRTGECQPTEPTDDAEARADFLVDLRWLHLSSSQWTSSSTLRTAGRNILHFTEIHWRDEEVLILIWTSCKKKRINDCWNVDSNKHLSDSWKGFTKFTLLKERRGLQKDTCRPWKDWQRFKRLPDHIMYGQKFWPKLVKLLRIERNRNGQKKKPKLDDARRLRWIYFIDPDNEEHKEIIIKIPRRKLERTVAPVMPCKRQSSITKVVAKPEIGSEKSSKTVFGCIVDSHGSTRQRAESLQSKTDEDRIVGKEFSSMTHYILVHTFIPMPQAMKKSRCKCRSG